MAFSNEEQKRSMILECYISPRCYLGKWSQILLPDALFLRHCNSKLKKYLNSET
jgi:hypothetical protein